MTDSATRLTVDTRMQRAAEKRLEQAGWVFSKYEYDETPESMEITQEQFDEAERALAGPYDDCDTCKVREILDAAFDVLRNLTPAERKDFIRDVWGADEPSPHQYECACLYQGGPHGQCVCSKSAEDPIHVAGSPLYDESRY